MRLDEFTSVAPIPVFFAYPTLAPDTHPTRPCQVCRNYSEIVFSCSIQFVSYIYLLWAIVVEPIYSRLMFSQVVRAYCHPLEFQFTFDVEDYATYHSYDSHSQIQDGSLSRLSILSSSLTSDPIVQAEVININLPCVLRTFIITTSLESVLRI